MYEEQHGLRVVNNATAMPLLSCLGNALTLNVDATGNNLTYQWIENGVDINGAISSTYQITPSSTGVKNYSVEITSSACQVLVTLSQNTTIDSVYTPTTPTIAQTGNLLQTQGYTTYQ